MHGSLGRRLGRVAITLVALAVTLSAPVLAASPASAATCKTRAVAYLISLPSGTVHFSGYAGDYSNGVGVWTTRSGEQFQLGGNGISPGTRITWSAVNVSNGQSFPIDPQPPNKAGSNCVVNQSPPTYSVTAPVGSYELRAPYKGGNTGVTHTDLELYANVVP